ncbi:hypothetical protein [Salsipaludibacter albus]|uniref:hypothetical protein n=1 Tax=Salsipaludibacter albus TaxID=2849650 RepID=UPI001EE41028|nr:hypothetical protein [Salsipaludibacter albus]MBY5163560.1 hypothetical protein [Salsipaludibacter albus]
MSPRRSLPRLLPWFAAAVVLAGCPGGSESPAPTSPVQDASAGPSSSDPSVTSSDATEPAATPTPTPSPTPVSAPSGSGAVVVVAADDTTEAPVGGDCMVSGPALPDDPVGDVLLDDVEVLIGVDTFVGPVGESVTDRPLVVVVDGEADDATVRMTGGPVVDWDTWQGPIGSLELADPVAVDGVTTVQARLTARLARGEQVYRRERAPQPAPTEPAPATPAPTDTPTAAASGVTSGVADVRQVALVQPAPSPSAAPVEALDLALDVVCTVVG